MYDKILKAKNDFDDTKRKQKEEANIEIVEHAVRIINSDKNMCKVLFQQDNFLLNLIETLEYVDFENVRHIKA